MPGGGGSGSGIDISPKSEFNTSEIFMIVPIYILSFLTFGATLFMNFISLRCFLKFFLILLI